MVGNAPLVWTLDISFFFSLPLYRAPVVRKKGSLSCLSLTVIVSLHLEVLVQKESSLWINWFVLSQWYLNIISHLLFVLVFKWVRYHSMSISQIEIISDYLRLSQIISGTETSFTLRISLRCMYTHLRFISGFQQDVHILSEMVDQSVPTVLVFSGLILFVFC